MHGAHNDAQWLRSNFGVCLRGLLDTALLARAAQESRLALGALLHTHFGVATDKAYARGDWRRRPLPADYLEYAMTDTRYLLPLAYRLAHSILFPSLPLPAPAAADSGDTAAAATAPPTAGAVSEASFRRAVSVSTPRAKDRLRRERRQADRDQRDREQRGDGEGEGKIGDAGSGAALWPALSRVLQRAASEVLALRFDAAARERVDAQALLAAAATAATAAAAAAQPGIGPGGPDMQADALRFQLLFLHAFMQRHVCAVAANVNADDALPSALVDAALQSAFDGWREHWRPGDSLGVRLRVSLRTLAEAEVLPSARRAASTRTGALLAAEQAQLTLEMVDAIATAITRLGLEAKSAAELSADLASFPVHPTLAPFLRNPPPSMTTTPSDATDTCNPPPPADAAQTCKQKRREREQEKSARASRLFVPRAEPLYHNISLLAPDNTVIARIDKRKAAWYMSVDAVDVLPPPTIDSTPLSALVGAGAVPESAAGEGEPGLAPGACDTVPEGISALPAEEVAALLASPDQLMRRGYRLRLRKVPRGMGHAHDAFHLLEKRNSCVVCGISWEDCGGKLNRCYLIPHIYRSYLPLSVKSYNSHDVVLTCSHCHRKVDIANAQLAILLSRAMGIPLSAKDAERMGLTARNANVESLLKNRLGNLTVSVVMTLRRCASALANPKGASRMPFERRAELLADVRRNLWPLLYLEGAPRASPGASDGSAEALRSVSARVRGVLAEAAAKNRIVVEPVLTPTAVTHSLMPTVEALVSGFAQVLEQSGIAVADDELRAIATGSASLMAAAPAAEIFFRCTGFHPKALTAKRKKARLKACRRAYGDAALGAGGVNTTERDAPPAQEEEADHGAGEEEDDDEEGAAVDEDNEDGGDEEGHDDPVDVDIEGTSGGGRGNYDADDPFGMLRPVWNPAYEMVRSVLFGDRHWQRSEGIYPHVSIEEALHLPSQPQVPCVCNGQLPPASEERRLMPLLEAQASADTSGVPVCFCGRNPPGTGFGVSGLPLAAELRVVQFVRLWRANFLSAVKPKAAPQGWSVQYRTFHAGLRKENKDEPLLVKEAWALFQSPMLHTLTPGERERAVRAAAKVQL
jgi:hypothetical protein